MSGEKAIHVTIFTLLLIGLCGLSTWVSHTYVQEDFLKIAGIALSWGVILLILYVSFKQLGWSWWS